MILVHMYSWSVLILVFSGMCHISTHIHSVECVDISTHVFSGDISVDISTHIHSVECVDISTHMYSVECVDISTHVFSGVC